MQRAQLGLWSGIGLVLGNVVGVGVLTNTGYMAVHLGPRAILLAWVVGGVMAMAGACCYGELARAIPRLRGGYRYLSDLLHPFFGTLAGWTSLLLGFSAPVALAASTAGPFFATVVPQAPPAVTGVVLILLATAAQAFDARWSKGTQDALALVKGLLIAGFIVVGLVLGSHAAPSWRAPEAPAALPVKPFAVSLVYIAFAFSGWNAVVYATEEFRAPRRTVPRAMLWGTALVTIVYLAVNAIFVANLSGDRLAGSARTGHHADHLGASVDAAAGRLGRGARDVAVRGVLPGVVGDGDDDGGSAGGGGHGGRGIPAAGAGRPPGSPAHLVGAAAKRPGARSAGDEHLRGAAPFSRRDLTLVSALTVVLVLRLRFGRTPFPRPPAAVIAAAIVYLTGSAWMLWYTLSDDPRALLWLAVVAVAAAIAYVGTARRRSAV